MIIPDDPDARTVRGEEFEINLSGGQFRYPVESATAVVKVGGITALGGGITNSLGKASASILVREDRPPGPIFVNASFADSMALLDLLGTKLDKSNCSSSQCAGSRISFRTFYCRKIRDFYHPPAG